MPIATMQPLLKTQIESAFNMGKAAQSDVVAIQIANAVASAVPSGLLPAAPSPIPLTPSGLGAAIPMIQNAYKMGKAAQPETVALQLANAISVIAPLCPPTGLSLLQTQLKNAFKLGKAAQPSTVATLMSQAIIQYYLSGGII